MLNLEDSSDKATDEVLDKRVNLALLEFKRANAIVNLKDIEKSLKEAEENLKATIEKAEQSGERIAVLKSASEIQDEIRLTDGHLGSACRCFRGH